MNQNKNDWSQTLEQMLNCYLNKQFGFLKQLYYSTPFVIHLDAKTPIKHEKHNWQKEGF